jgi:hypothetical protein
MDCVVSNDGMIGKHVKDLGLNCGLLVGYCFRICLVGQKNHEKLSGTKPVALKMCAHET